MEFGVDGLDEELSGVDERDPILGESCGVTNWSINRREDTRGTAGDELSITEEACAMNSSEEVSGLFGSEFAFDNFSNSSVCNSRNRWDSFASADAL